MSVQTGAAVGLVTDVAAGVGEVVDEGVLAGACVAAGEAAVVGDGVVAGVVVAAGLLVATGEEPEGQRLHVAAQ